MIKKHGKPVARLIGQEVALLDKHTIFERMAQEGLVELPRGNPDFTSKPVKVSGKAASQWILENRR